MRTRVTKAMLVLGSALAMALALAPPSQAKLPAAGQAATDRAATASPCGRFTRHVPWGADEVWYNHCGREQICIKVGRRGWTPQRLEVGPGETFLDTTAYVTYAYYIGLPHPTARCSWY